MKGQSRDHLFSNGDVALARALFTGRPNDDPQAALPLGWTYDPAELRRLRICFDGAEKACARARQHRA
jgi:hypothetical protein